MSKMRELPKVFQLVDAVKRLVGHASVPEPHIASWSAEGITYYRLTWSAPSKSFFADFAVMPHGVTYTTGVAFSGDMRLSTCVIGSSELAIALDWLNAKTPQFDQFLKEQRNEK